MVFFIDAILLKYYKNNKNIINVLDDIAWYKQQKSYIWAQETVFFDQPIYSINKLLL